MNNGIRAFIDRMRKALMCFIKSELGFGISTIFFIMIAYFMVFARLLFFEGYTFGGDTYLYWSFRYLILDSLKQFNALPWWDPTNFGGYPLYYHFLSGWSNYLGPYYIPSLILFKLLNIFVDVSINDYIVFHQTVYYVLLNITAVYLISRELVQNRWAAVLPPFIFAFSYFQLMNFHDFYAMESMVPMLYYLYGLIRFNNRRTPGSLLFLLLSVGLLFASLDNGIVMSAVFWGPIFSGLMILLYPNMLSDAFRILKNMTVSLRGKVIVALVVMILVCGFAAAWTPLALNSGHVIKYRGGASEREPVVYDSAGGITDDYRFPITTAESWSALLTWLPFPDIHDNLLRFAMDGHQNRYIGLVTAPLIITAIVIGLRNRAVLACLLTFFLCNLIAIYGSNNLLYRIITDSSYIFKNVTNISTILPRGGPALFLLFVAGIGFDRLLGIAARNEEEEQRDAPFQNLLRRSFAVLMIAAAVSMAAAVFCSFSPFYYWMRHSLFHIGIYLLIFSFICRVLLISNNVMIRNALVFCVFLFAFLDLTVSASESMANRYNFAPWDTSKHVIIPSRELAELGMNIPDSTSFKAAGSEAENIFPENYVGVYHNTQRVTWSVKEWMVLETRPEARIFLENWASRTDPVTNLPTGRTVPYPLFRLFKNGYYLPFEKIRELDTDRSIYTARPLFYLHDEKLAGSRNANPAEQVNGGYRVAEFSPNKVVLKTQTDSDGILCFLDNYDRFWSAYVDNKKVKIHRANFTFKAIELPAGEHTIEWIYNPYPVKIAYGLFYVLLIGAAGIILYERRRT